MWPVLFTLHTWTKHAPCTPLGGFDPKSPRPLGPHQQWPFCQDPFDSDDMLAYLLPPRHSQSKSYQINSIKSCSSRAFQEHQKKGPFQFLQTKILSYYLIWFDWIFSEEIIQYSRTFAPQVSKCHGTKAHACMHPSSSRAFQRHQEHDDLKLHPELSNDTKNMISSSSRAFQKTPRTWSQASSSLFSGSRNYKTKQTTFLHR
jgi:hypothetical protein